MAHQRSIEPKADTKVMTISVEEFIRTRDSVVTGLTTLIGAINDLNKAYLNHTNELLRGAGHGPIESLAIANFYQTTRNISATVPAPEKPKRKRIKKEKDPNAPKRPLTAFFLYSTQARPLVKNDMGEDTPPVEINNEILRRWNNMPESEKTKWKQQYELNKERYNVEMAEYKAQQGVDDLPGREDGDGDVDVDVDVDSLPEAEAAAEDGTSSEESSSTEEDDEEMVAPIKPPPSPSPPPRAKPAKASKRKNKENGAAPAQAHVASPSPTAQLLKETPVPLPTIQPKAGSPVEKRKRGKGDDNTEEPKKKKSRKSDVKETIEAGSSASVDKKSKKHKRNKDAA